MRMISVSFFLVLFLFIFISPVYAVDLSVEAPSQTLVRGQTFDFKVNIDTQGKSITKQSMIFSYDPAVVQFANILSAGDFFDSVGYQPDTGKILIVGESAKAKSGTGLVATVKMTITADSAGSTQLCTVSALDITPTKAPVKPSATGQPTRRPTTPVTGIGTNMIGGTVIGLMMLMASVTFLIIF